MMGDDDLENNHFIVSGAIIIISGMQPLITWLIVAE
jgi:hypothetical protein